MWGSWGGEGRGEGGGVRSVAGGSERLQVSSDPNRRATERVCGARVRLVRARGRVVLCVCERARVDMPVCLYVAGMDSTHPFFSSVSLSPLYAAKRGGEEEGGVVGTGRRACQCQGNNWIMRADSGHFHLSRQVPSDMDMTERRKWTRPVVNNADGDVKMLQTGVCPF